jgi:hypothetical protein
VTTIQSFDFSVNLLRALLWQYNDAVNLQGILQSKQDWYNTENQKFWEDWVRDVFDLRTANDFGLAVWAIILNVQLFVPGETVNPNKPTFGFGAFYQNFGRGNFFGVTSSTIPLNTEQRRIILQLRYFQLVTNGTVPQINRFLRHVFSDLGNSFVIDNLDMSCTYVFDFEMPTQLRYALESFDVLPRPAGVKTTYITRQTRIFAFDIDNAIYGGWNESVWS